jgi:chlorobactene glucosyltransferase
MHVLAVIALLVWILAFLNTILNLLLLRRLPATGPHDGPLVSVLIPARNEERTIERTVRAFLAQHYRNLEIIVVNDRSSDTTGAILDRLSTEDTRMTVIHGEPPPSGWLGKPWALHQGSRRANGELLLFVDADLIYSPDAVAAAVAELRESGVAMIAYLPYIEMVGFWEHIAMPMLAVACFTMMPTWLGNRIMRPRLGLGGGTGNLIRRADYLSAGGHEPLKDAVVDDIGLARLIRRSGGHTLALRAEHLVRLRMYHSGREIVEGFTKNMFAVLGHSYPAALFWWAVGICCHILPYALALTGNVLSIMTVALITLTRVLLFGSLRYRLDNALLGHPLMMSFWGFVLVRSTWITGIRGQLHWRGRTYDAGRVREGG